MSDATASQRRGALDRFLTIVEKGGNALPHPATLFIILTLAVVLASDLAARTGVEAIHPATGETVRPESLLTVSGLHKILTRMVTNFTGFAPLGTVLVAMLGIAIAEASGLIGTTLRLLVIAAPRKLLTVVIVFSGVMSNVGSEIGYVLLIPLAAIIFQAAGRHPLAGMAAAFAGVSGGYSANLLLGTVDPLLSGLTQEAARLIDPEATVNPACNYYFMAASTVPVTFIGTWVTEKIVAPRLGTFSDTGGEKPAGEEMKPLGFREVLGLVAALAATLALAAILLWGTVPANGFLRDPETGDLLHSPFMSGIVAIIFLGGAVCGLAYGITAGTFKSDADVMKGMGKSISALGSYLVLVFFAAQFVAYFNWTNLGLILAVKGAAALKASGLGGAPLLVGFVLLASVINLFMGSASAKWALMAPVFVPMLMLVGYPPEMTQVAYRIGDSSTNIISPMMSYFALIIAFFQRYEPKAGIGTLVATMLPYSVAYLVTWCAFFVGWILLELPLGPG